MHAIVATVVPVEKASAVAPVTAAAVQEPRATFAALLDAVRQQDVDGFMAAFHPEALEYLLDPHELGSVGARAKAAQAMWENYAAYETEGYPTLGSEVEGDEEFRTFQLTNPPSPQNDRMRFYLEGGRWLIAG